MAQVLLCVSFCFFFVEVIWNSLWSSYSQKLSQWFQMFLVQLKGDRFWGHPLRCNVNDIEDHIPILFYNYQVLNDFVISHICFSVYFTVIQTSLCWYWSFSIFFAFSPPSFVLIREVFLFKSDKRMFDVPFKTNKRNLDFGKVYVFDVAASRNKNKSVLIFGPHWNVIFDQKDSRREQKPCLLSMKLF